ncbi:MAG: carbon storage regulator CsrA [Sulfurospirillaceae bacterium]|jgi:carbon storage regulator|nr:carbon storage regulator CsrA [Sulfurospirillaceae bacterium]MCK9545379.1 carbon storage regulator CsrA [Sulfurospirillaceae bacterium]MDY0237551.1 carbon storage regulator CsrA [Campylobacterales bacterium]
MLVLSRKEGEGIWLGDDIELEVVEVNKGVVKLGIKAPKKVLILRSELAKAVEKSNLAAIKELDGSELVELASKIKFKK